MSEISANPGSLFAKMARVMGRLERFSKDGKFVSQKASFKYASADQVFEEVREAMAAENLACIPALISVEELPTPADKGVMMLVTFRYTLCCGDTGQTFATEWKTTVMQYGSDDKMLNKAATIGLKYFLMTTFIVSSGDSDEDKTAPPPPRTHQDSAPSSRPAAPAPFPGKSELAQQIEEYLDQHGIVPADALKRLHLSNWGAFPNFEVARMKIDEKLLDAPASSPQPQPALEGFEKKELPF